MLAELQPLRWNKSPAVTEYFELEDDVGVGRIIAYADNRVETRPAPAQVVFTSRRTARRGARQPVQAVRIDNGIDLLWAFIQGRPNGLKVGEITNLGARHATNVCA